MIVMRFLVLLSTLALAMPQASAGQTLSVLHIKVVLLDASQHAMPVSRYALLVSDNPATAAPRRILTAPDGTADIRLRPGNYTVESDRPVAFQGKAYQWTRNVDIVAGRDGVLELTAQNADIESIGAAATAGLANLEADPAFLLPKWQDSIVALWTPTARTSGFLIDARGLIATSQRGITATTSVEVQITAAIKVAARVLAADARRDVAVLWIDPTVLAAARPVPLKCDESSKPTVTAGQEIFTIGVPLREPKGLEAGTVDVVDMHSIASDVMLASGSAGGPVFAADGAVLGITSLVDEKDGRARGRSSVVRIDDVCAVVASAEQMMRAAAPPTATHLPVEPTLPFPAAALKDAAQRRAEVKSVYQLSSSEFDVALISPVATYAAHQLAEDAARERRTGGRGQDAERTTVRPLVEFGDWAEYVAEFPPVLLIRVTPRLVEGFWTTVARGAARTQGVALPPIKHFKSGLSRLRAYCGSSEVTPIHPLSLEQRVSDNDAIREGLYVFEPGALGPHCGSVKLTLFSEKEPAKGDSREIDPKVIQQIWDDFAPFRAHG